MDQQNTREGSKPQPRQTEEFKRSVIEHWLSSGKPAHQVAREFGIHPWNLRDWRHRYAPPPKAVDDPVPETPEAMRREIAQLRKELARVSTQRDILKKTLGIIAEP
jgi:transposase